MQWAEELNTKKWDFSQLHSSINTELISKKITKQMAFKLVDINHLKDEQRGSHDCRLK